MKSTVVANDNTINKAPNPSLSTKALDSALLTTSVDPTSTIKAVDTTLSTTAVNPSPASLVSTTGYVTVVRPASLFPPLRAAPSDKDLNLDIHVDMQYVNYADYKCVKSNEYDKEDELMELHVHHLFCSK